jgi:hypothetical protein
MTVLEIQRALLARGYDIGPAGADGDAGPDTIDAVEAFKVMHGFALDGIVGPKTRAIPSKPFTRRKKGGAAPAPVPSLCAEMREPPWLIFARAEISVVEGIGNTRPSVTLGEQSFGARFDPSSYLAANPDVRAAGLSPFEHFLEYGAREGRAVDEAGRRFDPSAYLSQNADVLAVGADPLTTVTYGAAEGRAALLVAPNGIASGVINLGLTATAGPSGGQDSVAVDCIRVEHGAAGPSVPVRPPHPDFVLSSGGLGQQADVTRASAN